MGPRTGETTHEFTTNRLMQIIGYIFIFGFALGVALVLVAYQTNWYQQLGMSIANMFIVNWWLAPSIVCGGALLLYIPIRMEREHKREKEAKTRKEQLLSQHS